MMTAAEFFFFMFAALMLASAVLVISARNPVHSVLFLILAFFNASALFLMTGAEFLALSLVIVYVGAVAVLFLFVVMMLNINMAARQQKVRASVLVGAGVGGVLLAELIVLIAGGVPAASLGTLSDKTNTHQLGAVLYTEYMYLFETVGLVLLVAMIGAIVLTLRQRGDVRRQSVATQVARRPRDTVTLTKPNIGEGVPY